MLRNFSTVLTASSPDLHYNRRDVPRWRRCKWVCGTTFLQMFWVVQLQRGQGCTNLPLIRPLQRSLYGKSKESMSSVSKFFCLHILWFEMSDICIVSWNLWLTVRQNISSFWAKLQEPFFRLQFFPPSILSFTHCRVDNCSSAEHSAEAGTDFTTFSEVTRCRHSVNETILMNEVEKQILYLLIEVQLCSISIAVIEVKNIPLNRFKIFSFKSVSSWTKALISRMLFSVLLNSNWLRVL